jgi:hypothetical protein
MADSSTLEAIENFSPEQLDPATKRRGFKKATAELLVGNVSVPTWTWHAKHAINTAVDVPILSESDEAALLDTAFEVVGQLLESGLTRGFVSEDFRDKTLALLQGEATVPEWVDFVGEVIETAIDVPYVPEFGEQMIFDRGLDLAAKTLHGLLVDGSGDGSKSGDNEE